MRDPVIVKQPPQSLSEGAARRAVHPRLARAKGPTNPQRPIVPPARLVRPLIETINQQEEARLPEIAGSFPVVARLVAERDALRAEIAARDAKESEASPVVDRRKKRE